LAGNRYIIAENGTNHNPIDRKYTNRYRQQVCFSPRRQPRNKNMVADKPYFDAKVKDDLSRFLKDEDVLSTLP
jgi:hypothetical protein